MFRKTISCVFLLCFLVVSIISFVGAPQYNNSTNGSVAYDNAALMAVEPSVNNSTGGNNTTIINGHGKDGHGSSGVPLKGTGFPLAVLFTVICSVFGLLSFRR